MELISFSFSLLKILLCLLVHGAVTFSFHPRIYCTLSTSPSCFSPAHFSFSFHPSGPLCFSRQFLFYLFPNFSFFLLQTATPLIHPLSELMKYLHLVEKLSLSQRLVIQKSTKMFFGIHPTAEPCLPPNSLISAVPHLASLVLLIS